MHRVAGEEVLAAAGCTRAAANRDEIERRTDVTEEAVVPLPGEDLRAVVQIVDARHGKRVVVRRRTRSDVVGWCEQAAADDFARLPLDPCHRVGLLRVLQKCDGLLVLEGEAPRDVRLAVAVLVGIEHVPSRGRERVPVRAGSRILAGDVVRDDRHRVRTVGTSERVGVRVVRGGILGDQRRFPVARSLGRRRAPALRCQRRDQRRYGHGPQEYECQLAHRRIAPFRRPVGVSSWPSCQAWFA